ncbi:MAG TPA: extracellular solute-binding protein [Hyphomicrobiaceae bacterium]|nr:extracellular solute-binding protein [Hyphomicrobiaceae bacterium]
MTITRRTFGAGTAAAAAGLVLGSRAEAQGLAKDAETQLYEAAKKEGQLTWYDAHHAVEQAEAYGKAFTAKYPGVKVNVVRTTANVAYQRFKQEVKAGGPQCDVLSSTDISHPIEMKKLAQVEKFIPANAATLIPAVRNVDPDGMYHVTSIGTVGITLNSGKVKEADAPKKWIDLVDPKWKNQVSVGHPGFSGYVSIWVWEMNRLYGWSYFEKLKANNPQIGRSIQDTLTMLRAGERTVAAGSFATALEAKAKGEPIDAVYPEEGTIIIVAPSCIVKGAKSPNAAKLFMEYMTSPASSEITVSYFGESIHDAVKAKVGKSLASVKTMIAPPEALSKDLAGLKEKWRDTFGV